jgi:hypothetical protein
MANVMSLQAERPETEVSDKAKRRRFTAKYKLRILREIAACSESGAVGALLRREGLYSLQWHQLGGREARAPRKPRPLLRYYDPFWPSPDSVDTGVMPRRVG